MGKHGFSRRHYLRERVHQLAARATNRTTTHSSCAVAATHQALSQAQESLLMQCIDSLAAGMSEDAVLFADYAERLRTMLPRSIRRNRPAAQTASVLPPRRFASSYDYSTPVLREEEPIAIFNWPVPRQRKQQNRIYWISGCYDPLIRLA